MSGTNVIPIIGSNSLTSLAADIRGHHQAVEDAGKSKLEHTIKAGEALINARELVKQTGGSWLKWLELNFSFSARMAQHYIKIASSLKGCETGVSHFSIRGAIKEMAASDYVVKPAAREKAPREMSADHKAALKAAHTGRIKAKRRNSNSSPIKQNFIPNVPGYLEEMLLTMERCVVEYEITPVDATARAIIAGRIKVEHFDEIINWLTQLKEMVHDQPQSEGGT